MTSGIGAQAGADIAPEGYEQAASIAGSMLPGGPKMLRPPPAGEAATAARKAQRFEQAQEMGIPVPPREMKPDKAQQKIQNAINKELGFPEGTELTSQALRDYRAAHYNQAWKPLETEPALGGTFKSTGVFKRSVRDIAKQDRELRSEFDVKRLLTRLVQLVHCAGFAELLCELRRGLGRGIGLIQERRQLT